MICNFSPFLAPKVWVWSERTMGGDVDCWIRGRPPSLSPLGKPYWRHHHMENSGFLVSRILQENESCINKYHLSCSNICVYLFCVQLMVIGCNLHCGSLQLCFLGETWDFVPTRNRAHYVTVYRNHFPPIFHFLNLLDCRTLPSA